MNWFNYYGLAFMAIITYKHHIKKREVYRNTDREFW